MVIERRFQFLEDEKLKKRKRKISICFFFLLFLFSALKRRWDERVFLLRGRKTDIRFAVLLEVNNDGLMVCYNKDRSECAPL